MKRPLLVIALAGSAISLAIIVQFALKSPTSEKPVPSSPSKSTLSRQEGVSPGLPVRLLIPKIQVDAAIDYVGLTPEGDLDVPKEPINAAWYKLGTRPGEVGSSVIDGHFGLKNNIPAVFDNLHTLRSGDRVYVKDEKGTTSTFIVRELRTYGPDEVVLSVFFSNDGKAHLNLITCQGSWSASQKSYSDRLVVFTDKE